MAMLTEHKREDFATLLAHNVLDASKGALFGTVGLKPDETNRTILIGLGGTGVRTINYVKGAISKRLDSTWSRYVAFLAVDTDWTELEGAAYLERNECVMVTLPNAADRASNPAKYPAAVHRFAVDEQTMTSMAGVLNTAGASRARLVGKFKVHDKVGGGLGNDQEIVHKLSVMKAERLAPLTVAHGRYNIYVIGSVCGGTCSGSFTELPALIRRVFTNPSQVDINAMLYLPDTLSHLDPVHESELYANGYASLKELNYYMGMYMRPEYAETWSYNEAANPELTYKTQNLGTEGFYDTPYLIGTTAGASADAARIAQETIAEFVISLLAEITTTDAGAPFLTESFRSNALNPARIGDHPFMDGTGGQVEASGSAHEFPRRFCSIGFAEASVPQKLVRAYTVGRVCAAAGLKPIAPAEYASLAAGGPGVLLPFRGKDDLLSAAEGTAKATALLEPLAKIMGIIHSGDFNFSRDLNEQEITWTKIKKNQYDNPGIAAKTEAVIKNRTADTMMDELKNKIKEAYGQFRINVQEYVREQGPYAFVNLYNGRFVPVGDNFGMGIGQMLQNLVNGKRMDGKVVPFVSPQDAKAALDTARNTIIATEAPFLGILTGKYNDQCAKWVDSYNKWGSARINKARRDAALGDHGALSQSFLLPAAKLTDELEAFGHILETMADIYLGHGRKMNNYESFESAADNKTEVNLAALNNSSYQWLKRQAENAVVAVNGKRLRDALVDNFFGKDNSGIPNTKKWLDYPQEWVTHSASGQLKLAREEMPVPAREIFDQIMVQHFPDTLQVSIEEMFNQLQLGGNSLSNIATTIITKLYAQSKPQFNGEIPPDACFGYIMYPASLHTTPDGQTIAKALVEAADHICPGIHVYATDDADSISFYQQATTLEVYRLNELKMWESHYEQGEQHILKNPYLHGKSPDVTITVIPGQPSVYTEGIRWIDYPPITVPEVDPRLPNPETGIVGREGKLCLELDKLINRAKELGVLYSEQVAGGWIVKRIHCNKATNWRFETTECNQDPVTGLLPLGKPLAEAVASQNGKTLQEMSRRVCLNLGGVMNIPHVTEEQAWEYAARTLRAHVPMHIEIRETVKKFEVWAKDIETFNASIIAHLLPAKLVWLVKGRVLQKKPDGTWVYIKPDGKIQNVAVLTPVMLNFLPPKDKYMIENGMMGYYLYGKMKNILPDQKAWDEAFKRAQNNIQDLIAQSALDELTAAEEVAVVILAEIEALRAKGARLDGSDAEPTIAFTKSLPVVRDALKDIDLFYFRMAMWENVF